MYWSARLEPCRTRQKPTTRIGDKALKREVPIKDMLLKIFSSVAWK